MSSYYLQDGGLESVLLLKSLEEEESMRECVRISLEKVNICNKWKCIVENLHVVPQNSHIPDNIQDDTLYSAWLGRQPPACVAMSGAYSQHKQGKIKAKQILKCNPTVVNFEISSRKMEWQNSK